MANIQLHTGKILFQTCSAPFEYWKSINLYFCKQWRPRWSAFNQGLDCLLGYKILSSGLKEIDHHLFTSIHDEHTGKWCVKTCLVLFHETFCKQKTSKWVPCQTVKTHFKCRRKQHLPGSAPFSKIKQSLGTDVYTYLWPLIMQWNISCSLNQTRWKNLLQSWLKVFW